jgi:hypothetical protein
LILTPLIIHPCSERTSGRPATPWTYGPVVDWMQRSLACARAAATWANQQKWAVRVGYWVSAVTTDAVPSHYHGNPHSIGAAARDHRTRAPALLKASDRRPGPHSLYTNGTLTGAFTDGAVGLSASDVSAPISQRCRSTSALRESVCHGRASSPAICCPG